MAASTPDTVTVVHVQPIDGSPEAWEINIGGLLLVRAGNPEDVLNFFDEYVPALAKSIEEAEKSIESCRRIHMEAVVMKAQCVANLPLSPPPEGSD